MTETQEPRDPNAPEAPVDQELLRAHEYDGIREYDNPLPGWWKMLFWATILFSIPYTIWYHVLGNDIYAAYEDEVAQAAPAGPTLETTAAGLMALMEDPLQLEKGRKIFERNCAACHTADGGGLVGPNLTDDHWIDVRRIEDIPEVVRKGVPAKGMTPWQGILSDDEIALVSAYVASLRGTTPANPKEPQGEVIPPWSAE